ncbi:MAG: PAS and helix-turn-helix domain-containing protein [Fuerstiella sp.]
MQEDLWLILKSQPGVGVLIIDITGVVVFCNDQAKKIYYGNAFDPIGMTIEEIEGKDFAEERMPIIHEVIRTGEARILRHIRGGRHTEAVIWPIDHEPDSQPRVMTITRQLLAVEQPEESFPTTQSQLVDLGPLDVLTKRELEVLALVGHGMPLKAVAKQLGVAQRTVERYRTDIARKLHFNSIAEAAQIVQVAGLQASDASLPRLHRWRKS